jgi:hypothetical protein
MLSESMAQYSALMVMEKEYGRDMMRKFLKYELESYLRGRGEGIESRPSCASRISRTSTTEGELDLYAPERDRRGAAERGVARCATAPAEPPHGDARLSTTSARPFRDHAS